MISGTTLAPPAPSIDARLTELERELDLLLNVTPVNGAEAWLDFERSDFATAPTLQQSEFRLGGIGTVRGHDYGERRGQAFWAAQVDVAPVKGRLRPVLFVDAGQAGGAESLFSGKVLAGAGIGLSMFGGFLRFALSHSLAPDDPGL